MPAATTRYRNRRIMTTRVYDHFQRQQTAALQPEYLFCNRKRLPDELQQLWPGPWTWAIYTVNTPEDAQYFASLGAGMVETDVIRQLMQTGTAGG